MVSQAFTTILPLLAVAISAAPQGSPPPLPPSNTTASPAPTVTPGGVEHYLQAQPFDDNPRDVVNNYVSSYHSGAGENNVTLVAQSEATKTLLNPDGGHQEFDLGTSYPWGFVMGGDTSIRGASFVGIDVGVGDGGFEVPSFAVGLVWNRTGFNGWLACDITGQTTGSQLFWSNETEVGLEVPEGCERVRLAPEYF